MDIIVRKFVPVEEIQLESNLIELKKGDSLKLIPKISPENATNKDVLWTSSNEKIVTVSKDGVITAEDAGTAEIKVCTKDGDKEFVSMIKVSKEIEEADDHGDTGETATKIKENELVTGKINSETDIDVFELELPSGTGKKVVLESPNGYVPRYSIQTGGNLWYSNFKGKELPRDGKNYKTVYDSDNTLDKRIRFFVDKTLVPSGQKYEFKVYVLQKGEETL